MDLLSRHGFVFSLLENCGIIAVNLFAIISGYLMCDKEVKIGKVFSLWGEAVLWSGLFGMLLYCRGAIDINTAINSFFPVSNGFYWYLNAYMMLLPFLPVINMGISGLGSRHVANLTLLLCLLGLLSNFPDWGNGMGLGSGYSTLWLLVLYFVGATIRLNQERIESMLSRRKALFLAVICPIASSILQWAYVRMGLNPWSLIDYNSPIVLLQSVIVFELFIMNDRPSSHPVLLAKASAAAFSVYLLDTSGFYAYVLPGKFSFLNGVSFIFAVPTIIIASAIMFGCFIACGMLKNELVKRFRARRGRRAQVA